MADTSSTTTTTSPRDAKIINIAAAGSSIGFAGGLIYAFKKDKKFWGYVGYSLLFSLIGGVASGGIAQLAVPMEKK